ncbi:lantibiotic dehydratase [Streptomyces rishiriensis]|uniref:lantibiotic dehydratase n=1 Tax=Streptomyces rishiriensis TaxID=68264 RepID=UPI0037D862CE
MNLSYTDDASPEDLINYIKSLVRDPVICEAIAVSSASLSLILRKIENGEEISPRRLMSAAVSLTRYVLRITSRPTPFGLNAGVAQASIGKSTTVSCMGSGTKTVRPDAGWFRALQQALLSQPNVRRQTDVVMSNLCFVRGGRLILPFVTDSGGQDGSEKRRSTGHEVSMRYTNVIARVRDKARHPIRYASLLRDLSDEFTRVDEEIIDAALNDLIRNQVLLTSFDTQAINVDAIRGAIALQETDSPIARSLNPLQEAFQAYEDEPVGLGTGKWEELKSRAASVPLPLPREVAQVDLKLNAEISLSEAIVDEVESYAAIMWKISMAHGPYSALHEYHDAFIERYGVGTAVPLPHVIDAHSGLGFPRGYLNPRVSHSSRLALQDRVPRKAAEDRRNVRLGELIHGALNNPARELVIDEEIIETLSDHHGDFPLPHSLELCFQLMASSSQAIDAGDFQLITSPMAGTPTAGAIMGRFAHMLGIAGDVASLIEPNLGSAISAQVTFQPRTPRMENVAHVPNLLPYEIPIGRFPTASSTCIDWRELFLVADRQGLHLYWGETGQEVLPVVPHLLTLRSEAPNLARFLSELRYTSERKIWQAWKWGQYGSHPILPRVRVGKVVSALLTWRPSQKMLACSSNQAEWEAAVAQWRHELEVAAHVRVSVQDKSYNLDLDNRFHREILRRNMVRGPVTVSEDPKNIGSYGWSDGRSNELVFPLLAKEVTQKETPNLTDFSLYEEYTHALDGEWMYLQISAVPEAHNRVIVELDKIIQKISERIDKWFFIRYSFPEPHIRLRLHAPSPELREHVWKTLLGQLHQLRQSGLARGFSHCEYEPEVGRYGGDEALRLAEQVFCIDSQVVVAELSRIAAGHCTVDKNVLLVANHAALLDSLGSRDWANWAGAALPKNAGGLVTRSEIETAAAIAVPGQASQLLENATRIEGIAKLWRESSSASQLGELLCQGPTSRAWRNRRDIALSGLLHMQHNRLIGIDALNEKKCLTLLGHVARLHVNRANHAT